MKAELETREPRWPKPGDRLFVVGQDWQHNAMLMPEYLGDKLVKYSIAYKMAADALADRTLETRDCLDLFIYPVVFLYRHYLELRLKDLIADGQRLMDKPAAPKYTHNLDDLWHICRPLLDEIFPEGDKAATDTVEACILELSKIDAGSMSFRYPFLKDESPTLPTLDRINLRNLKEVMGRISAFLDGSGDVIAENLQNKYSMEREAADSSEV